MPKPMPIKKTAFHVIMHGIIVMDAWYYGIHADGNIMKYAFEHTRYAPSKAVLSGFSTERQLP